MTTETTKNESNKSKKSPSKRSTGGVERARFDEALASLPSGLTMTEKAAWTKIVGPSGARIYVSRAKRVKQVDLSNFGKGLAGTTRPKVPNGKVQAHLDFRGSDDEVMARFTGILEALAALPAPEPKAKKAAKPAPTAKPAKDPSKKTARKGKIKERATEMGLGA